MGGSSGTQQQQTSQKSAPWLPTQPELQSLISQIGGQNTGVTPYQQGAVQNLQSGASGVPNFGPQVANNAQGLMSGLPNLNQNLQNSLSGLANPANLNPMNTPGLAPALQYMQQQIGNQINGQFAGAGRDLSPANSQALGYGEAGALAPLIMGQYNTNVGNLMGAAQGLNSGLLGNYGAGLESAGATPGLFTAPGQAQLGAGQAGFGLPFSNIGAAEGLTLPIAGLGGQSQGTSNTQTTQQLSPVAMAMGGASALGNFLNPFRGFGGQQSGIGGFSNFLGL